MGKSSVAPMIKGGNRGWRSLLSLGMAQLALLGLMILLPAAAHAATLTWDSDGNPANGATDGAGTWDTVTANWFDGTNDVVWPNTSGDIAVFGTTASPAFTVNLGGPIIANAVTFNPASAGIKFATGTSGTNTITVNNTTGVIVGQTVTGTGIGAGAVVSVILSATSLQLSVNNSAALTNVAVTIATPAITIANGGNAANTLTLAGTTPTITAARDATISAIIDGTDITKAGVGALTLSGTNTYTGTLTLTAGTLSVGVSANLGSASNPIIFNGGTLQVTGTAINNFGAHPVTFNPGATVGLDIGTAANTFTVSEALNQTSGGLTKLGAGTLLLTNAGNTYTGPTLILVGTLTSGANNAIPAASVLTIGAATGTTGTTGNLNLGAFNQTVAGLNVLSNSATADTITIGAGNTFTVNGAVTLGPNLNPAATTAVQTKLTMTGGGTFINTLAGGTFQVGGATGGTNNDRVTLDMSGLNTVTINLGATGTFRIGDIGTLSNVGNHDSSAILASTGASPSATITAGTIALGDKAGSSTHTPAPGMALKLGNGSNILNADKIIVGSGGATGASRASGQIIFNSAAGTVQIRAANGTGAAALDILNSNVLTATILFGLVDFTGHNADLLLSTLSIATRSDTGSSFGSTGTFSFNTGTLTVTGATSVGKSASSNATASNATTGTINIAGGTASFGSIALAAGTGTTAAAATINAVLNFTGGTITVGGDITKVAGGGVTTATLKLGSAGPTTFPTLNTVGHNVGTAANPILFTLTNTSTLDMGSAGVHRYVATGTWAGTLFVLNWNGNVGGGGTTQLFYGTDATGLTAGQLAEIKFNNPVGFPVGFSSATQLGTGEVVPAAPTAVRLISLIATRYTGSVWVDWETSYESNNLGFNVYREQRGRKVRLNTALIAGSALQLGTHTGNSYSWPDLTPNTQGAKYWLEDVDLNGTSTWHGPVTPRPGRGNGSSHRPSPLLGQTGRAGSAAGGH